MGLMLSAASCNKWWMDDIIGTKDYGAEQENITKLGENHVFFLPYLMGERSPHNDPNARGTFIGPNYGHHQSRYDKGRQLKVVAFALRQFFQAARSLGIHIACSRICGGGAKELRPRKTIAANVLEHPPVHIPEMNRNRQWAWRNAWATACGDNRPSAVM